jgi:hypothetical protein
MRGEIDRAQLPMRGLILLHGPPGTGKTSIARSSGSRYGCAFPARHATLTRCRIATGCPLLAGGAGPLGQSVRLRGRIGEGPSTVVGRAALPPGGNAPSPTWTTLRTTGQNPRVRVGWMP